VQSRPADEIIIVDNGSLPPVNPGAFVDVPGSVVVVREETAVGAARARNIGVGQASGEFVAFLDDDDTWSPTKLEFLETCLSDHPDTDVVIHRTCYQIPDEPQNWACSHVGDPLMRMIRSQPPHINGVAVRRALHMDVPFDETLPAAEDLDYLISLAKSGACMFESKAILAVFHRDESSMVTIDTRIEGRLSLLGRHPEILTDDAARSFFYVRLGHLQRNGGQRSPSVGSFVRAIRARPGSGLAWKGLARTLASW